MEPGVELCCWVSERKIHSHSQTKGDHCEMCLGSMAEIDCLPLVEKVGVFPELTISRGRVAAHN